MKKISITLLLCLLCLTGMAQGQKGTRFKDITSGRFRPENIQGVIPMPDGEHYTQMNADGAPSLNTLSRQVKVGSDFRCKYHTNVTSGLRQLPILARRSKLLLLLKQHLFKGIHTQLCITFTL